MIRSYKSVLIIIALTMVLPACKKHLEDPSFNQYYNVTFYKNSNLTDAAASFTVGSSTQKVIFGDRSLVTANGIIENLATPNNGAFSWTLYDTAMVTFSLTKKGHTIYNTVPLSAVPDLTIVIDSVLSRTDTIKLSFTGPPQVDSEHISVTLTGIDDSLNVWHGISGEFIDGKCTLDFSATSKLYPGTYTVKSARETYLPLTVTDGDAGGFIYVALVSSTAVRIE